jgi:hypothetical protein
MASGDTLQVFTPMMAEPPASAPAAIDLRNGHPVVAFDSTTDEETVFTSVLPQHYAGGGITVHVHWTSNTTSGTARWQTSFESLASQDIDSDGFATANSGGTACNGTSGVQTTTSIAHANGGEIDALAVGDPYRLKIRRDADGTTGTDDMAADAQILAVELRET